MHANLFQNFPANKDKSKRSIVNQTLSQDDSEDVDNLCSTEIDKSEYTHMTTFNISNLFEYEKNLTFHMKERTWLMNAMNTLRTSLTL